MLKYSLLYCRGPTFWGIGQSSRLREKLHLFATKKLLGVGMRTPNDLVSAELGRYPIYINVPIRCVRYWVKLARMTKDEINVPIALGAFRDKKARMNVNRLPFKACKMLCDLDERGKTIWVSNVCHFLRARGFYVCLEYSRCWKY